MIIMNKARRVLYIAPRTAGQTMKAVTEFMAYICTKKKALWFGPGYVAMSNDMYKELIDKAYPTKFEFVEK